MPIAVYSSNVHIFRQLVLLKYVQICDILSITMMSDRNIVYERNLFNEKKNLDIFYPDRTSHITGTYLVRRKPARQ